jgi:hypothetical protein
VKIIKLVEVFVKWQADFSQILGRECVTLLSVILLRNRPDILYSMVKCHFDLAVALV